MDRDCKRFLAQTLEKRRYLDGGRMLCRQKLACKDFGGEAFGRHLMYRYVFRGTKVRLRRNFLQSLFLYHHYAVAFLFAHIGAVPAYIVKKNKG